MTFYTRNPDKKRCFDLDCEEHNEQLAKRLHERYCTAVDVTPEHNFDSHSTAVRATWLADARELRTPR